MTNSSDVLFFSAFIVYFLFENCNIKNISSIILPEKADILDVQKKKLFLVMEIRFSVIRFQEVVFHHMDDVIHLNYLMMTHDYLNIV